MRATPATTASGDWIPSTNKFMHSDLFESIIRSAEPETGLLSQPYDEFSEAGTALFHEESVNFRVERIFEAVLREANQIDTQNLPAITIEVNAEENNYFNAIQSAKTKEERGPILKAMKTYYTAIFRNNFQGKSVTNNASKIKVMLKMTGLSHCFQEGRNYFLWPVIRSLSTIIENAHYKTEPSQHINDPKTHRGNLAYVFYHNVNYVTKIGETSKEEVHTLRISAVTYKKGDRLIFTISRKIKSVLNYPL